MNTAYLLTGSNLVNRQENLEQALTLLNTHCGRIVLCSSVYETAAWGKTDQPHFLNQALKLETTLNAKQLMRRILKVEKLMGRERKEKYGPRLIDIDILLFNDEILDYSFLKIPHPEMQHRRFALLPLSEIGGNIYHPVLKKTVTELLSECPDMLDVKKYS
jgi:2-amino-4-hydroxy-6-hydroxymethyldihydropteridine diphosphokinase